MPDERSVVERRDVTGPPELFDATYTPGLVRFWLEHWSSLVYLSFGSGGQEGERLAYEWRLLLERKSDPLIPPSLKRGWCLCQQLFGTTYPTSLPSGSIGGDPNARAKHLISDLEQAADRLPIAWTGTRQVLIKQQRVSVGRVKLAKLRHERFRLGLSGTGERETVTYHEATAEMARALGWRPKQDVAEAA